MSELEMKIEALIRCVGAEAYEKAMTEIQNVESPKPAPFPPVDIDADIENAVQKILVELGTPAHIKGYRYTVTGIRLVVNNPDLIDAITRELYPQIATAHKTTPSRVERAVRHAIEVTWDRGDLDTLAEYFGNTISITKGKPTNSEFLAMLSNVIRRKLNIR